VVDYYLNLEGLMFLHI